MAAPQKPPKAAPAAAKRATKKQKPAAQDHAKAAISFGPEICNDLAAAEQREWLVTNGLGGFASGTVAGSSTRRYHGLLIAALAPPSVRTHLVGGLDELATVDGKTYELATHRWASGAVAPQGFLSIQNFRLDGSIPVWT